MTDPDPVSAAGAERPGEGAPETAPERYGEGHQEPQPHPDNHPDKGAQRLPLHPSLEPRGEAVAWSALGSLLGGPIVWGGVGMLADRIFGTGRTFLVIGIVVGAVTGLWIVYVRFGHDDGEPRS